jgi:hypothetical protein
VQVVSELLSFGVPGERVLPVINRAPRSNRARAQLTTAMAELMPEWAGSGMPSPLFVPERRIDDALRDGVRVPDSLAATVARAFTAVITRADPDARRPDEPQLVVPGALGSWGAATESI